MKFEKFSIASELKDNLLQNEFYRTTNIQYKAIPAILNGEDVLAIAQTGSGKNATFAIPVFNQIPSYEISKRSHSIKSIVVVPTRNLAKQRGKKLTKFPCLKQKEKAAL